MKQRKEFNVDNTSGLDAQRLAAVNRGYDLWYDANQFHGKDFTAWRVKSEAAKKHILEISARVARDSETADPPDPDTNAVQPVADPFAKGGEPKPALPEGQAVDGTPWPPEDGTTGENPVDPNTLQPSPRTLPGLG